MFVGGSLHLRQSIENLVPGRSPLDPFSEGLCFQGSKQAFSMSISSSFCKNGKQDPILGVSTIKMCFFTKLFILSSLSLFLMYQIQRGATQSVYSASIVNKMTFNP